MSSFRNRICRPFAFLAKRLLIASLVSTLVASNTSQSLEAGERVSLFDGTSLNGFDGEKDRWRVENGAIVGEIPAGTTLNHNTWLVAKDANFADFELTFRFRISGDPSANSGVQIRSQVKDVREVIGYQCDLDGGETWLGRIYDEHGRALLVERGSRVRIDSDGKRTNFAFAPAHQYRVLTREDAWNEYRIVAIGDQIDVYVNGTLFSQLIDREENASDLNGAIAFQLHSGGHTRIEFKDIFVERLSEADRGRLRDMDFPKPSLVVEENSGVSPETMDGAKPNFGFELGNLNGWKKVGDAFDGQPVNMDGIAKRWPGQTSSKEGDFFVGGYELKGDQGVGTLTSASFRLTHPFCSFRISGGSEPTTRVELVSTNEAGQEEVLLMATGDNREQMRRLSFDVAKWRDRVAFVRVIDETKGGWGHINFDDFRFHDQPPGPLSNNQPWRSTENAVLNHLKKNPVTEGKTELTSKTLQQMFVPEGFSVVDVASEPDVHQPIAFTFDAKGRIWVVEGHSYPEKRPEGAGLDRIVIFADNDGDGKFETRKVFVEGLNLVSGIEVGMGGVWIGAAPELLFIPDKNNDDVPDGKPQVLLDGFGYADTHETLNSFMWGPDGWLYGTQGVFNSSAVGKPGAPLVERVSLQAAVWRFHPVTQKFEVFAHGGSNPWGLDFDEHGQIFMTHCRSFFGRGLTTHVIQGGHFWNQVNSGYAPYISANEVPGVPNMQNYLLASARYGHGEGGAGKPGTGEVFGGHSHVGTMIYLGDNWPDQYRNHLFTHNLHGHQINHQINLRQAGGYNTVHAGEDVLFCADQQFIGVDLQVGPDGAVYMIDWYDPRHCHNPNVELWDRGNGRVYRMQYDATFAPASLDLSRLSDLELAQLQGHKNDWHARTARILLAERATSSKIQDEALAFLTNLFGSSESDAIRLRALWSLHAVRACDAQLLLAVLNDESEYVRAWGIQLACERDLLPNIGSELEKIAANDKSLFVLRYVASAIQRMPAEVAWKVSEKLLAREVVREDRDLPKLLWQSFAPLAETNWDKTRLLQPMIADSSIQNYLKWYYAKSKVDGVSSLVDEVASTNGETQRNALHILAAAVSGVRNETPPKAWSSISSSLYRSEDVAVRNAAKRIGASFSDPALFVEMRSVLRNAKSDIGALHEALDVIALDSDPENLEILLPLLSNPKLAQKVIGNLRRFDSPVVAETMIRKVGDWNPATLSFAVEVLASRVAWSNQLLDAVQKKEVKRDLVTAYHVRQMIALGDAKLTKRLTEEWGSIRQSSAQLREEITKTTQAYKGAPLWAFSENEGAKHFKKLCANCHRPEQPGIEIAPKLEGTSAKGIEYLVENVIDPNAVIGKGYQAYLVTTSDGQTLTGVIQAENATSLTLRTATETVVISKSEIEDSKLSENSFMPIGLLDTLNDRERIELLKYLMSQ